MFKATCVLLCLCQLLIGSYGSSVSFIDKCVWSDKECLKTSAQKAVPYFADGIPELGMIPLDPMKLGAITMKEGELHIEFLNTVMIGAKKCKIVNVERSIDEHWLKVTVECPIKITGDYKADGKMLTVVTKGEGAFYIQTDKIRLDFQIAQKLGDGSDGQKHWQLGNYEFTFDVKEKAHLHFEGLFNGDQEKAAPVLAILDQNSDDVIKSMGKPFIDEVIKRIVEDLKIFARQIPASELEI